MNAKNGTRVERLGDCDIKVDFLGRDTKRKSETVFGVY